MLKFGTVYNVTTGWKTWEHNSQEQNDLEEEEEKSKGGDGNPFFLELLPPYAFDENGNRITDSPVQWMNEFEARKNAVSNFALSFTLCFALFLFH